MFIILIAVCRTQAEIFEYYKYVLFIALAYLKTSWTFDYL